MEGILGDGERRNSIANEIMLVGLSPRPTVRRSMSTSSAVSLFALFFAILYRLVGGVLWGWDILLGKIRMVVVDIIGWKQSILDHEGRRCNDRAED